MDLNKVDDDEFEDFEVEDWEGDMDEPIRDGDWEESWDDDAVDDDLSRYLEEKIYKQLEEKQREPAGGGPQLGPEKQPQQDQEMAQK